MVETSVLAKVGGATLVVMAVVSVVGLFVVDGGGALAEPLLFLYISLVVAYGIFIEDINHPLVQGAFGVGVVAYGGYVYRQTGSLVWLAVSAVGVVLIVHNAAVVRD